jgi:Holliday junction resolvasome RuvABC endonuclease subunit
VSADQLRVLGLDLSLTSTGCAKAWGGVLLAEAPETFTIRSGLAGFRRLEAVITRLGAVVSEFDPDLIMVEGPSLHSTGSHYHEGAGLWWNVTYRLWKSKRPMVIMAPSVLKKFATGRGNADKIAMCGAAITRFGRPDLTQPDEVDALWLAAAGCQHYGLPLVSLPAAQAEYLESVKSGRPLIDWPALPERAALAAVPAVP